MEKKKIKFIVGSGLIVAAVGLLISSGISKTSQYFLTVDELAAQGSSNFIGAGLKVKGNVVPGSIKRNPDNYLDLAFEIEEKQSLLQVKYNGVTPDMFLDGREVVVEGTLSEDGTFHANTVLTSCPSKYEAEKELGATHPGSIPDTGTGQKQLSNPVSFPKA